MLQLKSKDQSLTELISSLASLLVDHGCAFDASLRLEVHGSELSFAQKKAPEVGASLITLQQSCMPAMNDYDWSLDERGQLQYQPVADRSLAKAELHDQIVALLVNFYNRFDKVRAFGESSPAVQFFSYPEFFKNLFGTAHEHRLKAAFDQGLDALMVEAFWQGRVFSSINTGQVHLIPLMEFFNHHLFASPFGWGDVQSDGRPLMLPYKPLPKGAASGKELFACYEVMDNLHAYTKYGFIDQASFFVQSQPFKLTLSDGLELEIGYQSVTANQCYAHEWAPDPLYQNSLMYRARIRQHEGRYFLPYMLVPPSRHMPAFDDALRAQLRQIEVQQGIVAGSVANKQTFTLIKKTLLEQNLDCYRSMKTAAESAGFRSGLTAARQLAAMIKHQVAILRDFNSAL